MGGNARSTFAVMMYFRRIAAILTSQKNVYLYSILSEKLVRMRRIEHLYRTHGHAYRDLP